MSDARCFLDNAAVLINVVQPFADLDESHILIAFEGRAVYITAAAFTVITLSIPAIECEGDLLVSPVEKAVEILTGDFRVVIDQVQLCSQLVRVHDIIPPFWYFRSVSRSVVPILTLNGGDSKRLNLQKMRSKDCVEYTLAILAIVW